MNKFYKNGNVIIELTPREAAIYSLMTSGGYTEAEAENMLQYIYMESVKRLNCTVFRNINHLK